MSQTGNESPPIPVSGGAGIYDLLLAGFGTRHLALVKDSYSLEAGVCGAVEQVVSVRLGLLAPGVLLEERYKRALDGWIAKQPLSA